MDCVQYVEMDHAGGPDFYSSSKPRARKKHKCTECGRAIYPGEQYLLETGVSDKKFAEITRESACRFIVADAGHTEIPAGTITCAAFYEVTP